MQHEDDAMATMVAVESGSPAEAESGSPVAFDVGVMHEMEERLIVPPASRKIITDNQRRVQVAWMTTVRAMVSLRWETVLLSVYLFDRVLSSTTTKPASIANLATTCLFVACKFHEAKIISTDDVTQGKPSDFARAERYVVDTICSYDLSGPSICTFLEQRGYDVDTDPIVQYFVFVAVMDRNMRHFLPSVIADSIDDVIRVNPKKHAAWPACLSDLYVAHTAFCGWRNCALAKQQFTLHTRDTVALRFDKVMVP